MRIIASVLILPLLTLIWLQGTWVLLSEQGMRRQMGLAPEQPVANTSTLKEGHYQLSMVCFNHPAQVDGLFVAGMSIKPGERIALMGDPGSGKSTLIKLLAGMHAPDSGAVKLDRFHVKDTAPRLLQQELAYLPQNVQLLTGTLRDNLLAGQENVPDSDLLDLCQSIGLMPLINAHGEGLSMPLHNSHQGVSAGQRQLIGLARLFLRRPRIWLLDEPFAHLNAPLRHRVLGLLQSRIRPDQPLICTGDQAELLHLVQRFVVMGSGRVVMDGPSDQVMPRWLAYLQQRKSSFDPKSGAEYQI